MTNPYTPQQPYGQPHPQAGLPPQSAASPVSVSYAPWGRRALGGLIDYIAPVGAMYSLIAISAAISIAAIEAHNVGLVITATIVQIMVYLAIAVWQVWNTCWRRGTTGQSLGQRVAKIATISEYTGRPLGGGTAFLRQIAHVVDALIFYVGYLWPLWDQKRQTLGDKMIHSVVVPVEQLPGGSTQNGLRQHLPQQPMQYGPPPQQQVPQPGQATQTINPQTPQQ